MEQANETIDDYYYVYTITGAGLTYYGSSGDLVCERKSKHNSDYKHWKNTGKGNKTMSYVIMEMCDDWEFNVIETDYTKQEALDREKWFILNNECVNKNLPYLTEDERKEYQRVWAEKKRREKGIPERTAMTEEERKEKARISTATRRANMTEEEKEEHLKKRRETRKELTEEQKERAKERAKAHREKVKADPQKAEEIKKYKAEKAREYRAKNKSIK